MTPTRQRMGYEHSLYRSRQPSHATQTTAICINTGSIYLMGHQQRSRCPGSTARTTSKLASLRSIHQQVDLGNSAAVQGRNHQYVRGEVCLYRSRLSTFFPSTTTSRDQTHQRAGYRSYTSTGPLSPTRTEREPRHFTSHSEAMLASRYLWFPTTQRHSVHRSIEQSISFAPNQHGSSYHDPQRDMRRQQDLSLHYDQKPR